MSDVVLTDKKGRRIMEGDLVEVFHFVGPGRKHNFMYKIIHAIDGHLYGAHAHNIYRSGLSLSNSYALPRESKQLMDYEIIEGFNGGEKARQAIQTANGIARGEVYEDALDRHFQPSLDALEKIIIKGDKK